MPGDYKDAKELNAKAMELYFALDGLAYYQKEDVCAMLHTVVQLEARRALATQSKK